MNKIKAQKKDVLKGILALCVKNVIRLDINGIKYIQKLLLLKTNV